MTIVRLPREFTFTAATAVLGLALGRVLPGRLETLSGTKLALVPVALVFVLVASWLAIERPVAGFALGFALLGLVRFEPAPVDLVFALLIIGALSAHRIRPRIPAYLGSALALFVVLTVLSSTNAIGLGHALKFEATTVYLIALAVWLSSVFSNGLRARLAMRIYIVVAAVSGGVGVAALYLPIPARHLLLFDSSRAEGFFKDPNVYGAFLVPAAVILLEELSTPRLLNWKRNRLALAFALASAGVVVAYSRAAWLNFALAVVTVIAVQMMRRRGIKLAMKSAVALGVAGLLGLALLIETGSISFFQQRSHLESYDSQRFANQSSAFTDMTRHALGYGPGQTEIRLPLSTHSAFARTAYEQGLLGITLLIVIFGGTALCALLLARRTTNFHGIGSASLLGIWLGQVANSFFIDTMHWRHLWIFAGLIWCGYYSTAAASKEPAASSSLTAA